MVESTDLGEQSFDVGLPGHVGREGAGLAERRKRSLSLPQLLLRSADKDHIGAFFQGGGRDAETNAGAAANDEDFLAYERCHEVLQFPLLY